MSFEISPVLAGKFDTPDYIPASTNIGSTASSATAGAAASDAVSGPDSRRYTQFDRSATDAGTATMSFGDFLDMINPLEHIPVVSSIYRAVTNESINPVSRVVGDVIYGGLIGPASAVIGGMGAVADAGLEAQTGKDSGGLTMAALFGPDSKQGQEVQLADAHEQLSPSPDTGSQTTAPVTVAQADNTGAAAAPTAIPAQVPVQNNPAPVLQASVSQASGLQTAPAPKAQPANPVLASNDANDAVVGSNAIPVSTAKSSPANKQPFGGVAGPPNIQAQDMAIALSAGSPTMRMGHTIYTSKLANGPHPLPPMITPTVVTASQSSLAPVVAPPPVVPTLDTPVSSNAKPMAPVASSNSLSAPMAGTLTAAAGTRVSGNQIPSDLMQDMMLKAISQYGHVASAPMTSPGAMFDLTN